MRTSIADRIKQSANDLLKHNHLPERDRPLLTDLNNLNAAIHSVQFDLVKEWRCKDCNIVVFGPKKWMIEHSKTHAEKKEIRENEIFTRDYKIY